MKPPIRCQQQADFVPKGCRDQCSISPWTSHGACRDRSERQFDGCDCFGSRSAFLTSAGLKIPPDKTSRTGARINVLAPPGDWLATLAEVIATSTRSLVKRAFRWQRHRVPSNRSSVGITRSPRPILKRAPRDAARYVVGHSHSRLAASCPDDSSRFSSSWSSSKCRSMRSLHSQEPRRQPGGVTCLCVVTVQVTTFALAGEHRPRKEDDRIRHRVWPAEVTASKSSSTDNAEQIENRQESRHITEENPLSKKRTLSRVVLPFPDTLPFHKVTSSVMLTTVRRNWLRIPCVTRELSTQFEHMLNSLHQKH